MFGYIAVFAKDPDDWGAADMTLLQLIEMNSQAFLEHFWRNFVSDTFLLVASSHPLRNPVFDLFTAYVPLGGERVDQKKSQRTSRNRISLRLHMQRTASALRPSLAAIASDVKESANSLT